MTAGASTYRSYTVKDAVTVEKGMLLTIQTSDGKLDLTAATEVCHLVALDESSRDGDNALVTAGATVTGIPIGGTCFVRAIASESWTAGDELFVGAGGLATATAGSNKKLGIYLGPAVTTVAGDLYEVNTNGAEQI